MTPIRCIEHRHHDDIEHRRSTESGFDARSMEITNERTYVYGLSAFTVEQGEGIHIRCATGANEKVLPIGRESTAQDSIVHLRAPHHLMHSFR